MRSTPRDHFNRDMQIRNALDEYYSEALASKEAGFSPTNLQPYISQVKSKKLHFFVERIITFLLKTKLFSLSKDFTKKLDNLLTVNQEAKVLITLHKKSEKFTYKKNELPFVFLDNRILHVASELKIKSKKYQKAINTLEKLQLARFDSKAELSDSLYNSLPHSVSKIIEGVLQLEEYPEADKVRKDVYHALKFIERLTNKSGKNVLKQISDLLVEKRIYIDDLAILDIIQTSGTQKKDLVKQLSPKVRDKLQVEGPKAACDLARSKLKEVKKIFNAVLEEADGKLSVYEVSTDRLAEKYSKEELMHPLTVTMVGVEYAGLIKEGGLAEALEGLSQGLLRQNGDNKVRLIFPKFNLLPKNIQQELEKQAPTTYLDHLGTPFTVYKHTINGVECHFIDHPSFSIHGPKQSIYAGTDEELKTRFATFSSLAADLLGELPKTDIIHLHDWHVAGVELKLRNQKREIAPIVFTYHNNQRMAQGRYFSQVYNYEPIIQSLRRNAIATQNVNLMVDAVKNADAVTTVSGSFAIESQSIERGEGVSFAIREAARTGKLSGVLNGTNVDRWDPEHDPTLKQWKDLQTGEPIDLSYGRESNIVDKKALCKAELQKWIAQEFPHVKFDCSKPIITYVGRYDWYQKGLDKFEEAIEATLKNGGQFICMGSLEDEEAKKVLDRLQKKYTDGVLVIRDYKSPEGKLYYQQGTSSRPAIGSVIRAASDFTFIPSRFEPCGLVQFESWLFGTSVIASKVGGLADTVDASRGYLFDPKSSKSLALVIKQALNTFSSTSTEAKQKSMSDLMGYGKKCSWNDAPRGHSPVEKYLFVYKNAQERAKSRIKANATTVPTFDLQRYRRLLHQLPKPQNRADLEERYIQAYYKKDLDKAIKLFKSLPKGLRQQMPPPYTLSANTAEYEKLGAHYSPKATVFRVHAPMAKTVSVQLFDKHESVCDMTQIENGIWECSVKNLGLGTEYQYVINGEPKLDPYGIQTAQPRGPQEIPRSVIACRDFTWQDDAWMQKRPYREASQPMSIYELHPTSWQTQSGQYLNYRELAEKIVSHCKETGYTHVELMGILEHPDQRSFGYQVSNYFSPNSRMGSIEDFKYLVSYLHKNNIAIILDWVPGHFCIDDFALSKFDGTNQFEPSKVAAFFSLRHAFTHMWGTEPFDYKKKAVRDFLYSSAAYWLKEMHIDGLRVDAVRMILGSEDSRSAKVFLRTLNDVVHTEFPGTVTIAEDYSGSLKITKATSAGGFGFDFKWNTNWTKHIIDYLSVHPKKREYYYSKLIQGIEGDLFHKMVLAISHDEILKSPLIDISPDLTSSQKYANLRALFGLMMCLPGKKLFFMGSEIGSDADWNSLVGVGKGVMDTKMTQEQKKMQHTVQKLHELYKSSEAFWQHDDNAYDLTWIEKNDPESSFIAYRRESDDESFACFHNFSLDRPKEYEVDAVSMDSFIEVFNSNKVEFGGDGNYQNMAISVIRNSEGAPVKYRVIVPPLSTVVIKETKRK